MHICVCVFLCVCPCLCVCVCMRLFVCECMHALERLLSQCIVLQQRVHLLCRESNWNWSTDSRCNSFRWFTVSPRNVLGMISFYRGKYRERKGDVFYAERNSISLSFSLPLSLSFRCLLSPDCCTVYPRRSTDSSLIPKNWIASFTKWLYRRVTAHPVILM